MLHIDKLNFEYGGHPLFHRFSLRLDAGITWLRGENGAGKTTLLKLAAGALLPHAGSIALMPACAGAGPFCDAGAPSGPGPGAAGGMLAPAARAAGTERLSGGSANTINDAIDSAIDSAAAPLEYRLHTYYCGGDTPQLPWLTVRELLDLHAALYPATDAALLDGELRALRLHGALDQPLTTLSLGQHKKMQLALALALPVVLLLMDEPFNGLDAAAVAYLRAQLADPARRARQCIVLTSHLAPELPLAHTVQL